MRSLLVLGWLLAACDNCDDTRALAPDVRLSLLDAQTGQEVASPSFTVDDRATAPFGQDSQTGAWLFILVGRHTIGAAATGYATGQVTIDTGVGNCGYPAHSVETTLRLQPQ